jgi:hypothetical protein
MARGIDHVVHAVHDLDAAAALYRALGFQVGARNRHPPPWGTQNHIVQLPGCFVELLTVAEPEHIAPHGPRFFSFGAFNRDALARGEGPSMLVLESGDARADAQDFYRAGIGDFEMFDFEREARRPNGTPIKVAFSLAFARDPRAPEIGFFTCQHRFPENFWNPAFQIHPNTANGMAGVVMVAAAPSDHRAFLSAFTGNETDATTADLAVTTPRGEIQVMQPGAFERRFGEPPPDIAASARLAALRFAVRDLGAVADVLRGAGVASREQGGSLVIGPQSAMGATLVFEPLRDA